MTIDRRTRYRWWAGAAALVLAGTVAVVLESAAPAAASDPPSGFLGWGTNSWGSLGDGTVNPHPTPVPYLGPTIVFTQLAVDDHTIALAADGTVWGWGENNLREVLPGFIQPDIVTTPVQVPNLSDVRQIAVGVDFSLAVTQDGQVHVWGEQVGYDLTNDPLGGRVAGTVPGLSDIVQVAADSRHALALRADGAVFAWGLNIDGVLGTGDTDTHLDPVRVTGLPAIAAIGTGLHHSLAAGRDGTVWAWGDNSSGQLGLGSNGPTETHRPVQVHGLPDVAVSQLGGGFSHSVVRLADGTLWAWGDNTYGQLGTGNQFSASAPVPVQGLTAAVISLSVGSFANAAVTSTGTALMWGDNRFNQLGDGTQTPRFLPGQVGSFDHVTAVSTGLFNSGMARGILATVPDLGHGVTESAARSAIAGAGLTVGRVTYQMDFAPAGTVIGQNPAANTVEPGGASVDLTVSSGAVTVPNMLSMSKNDAVNLLTSLGLGNSTSSQVACVDPGGVLNQNPNGGTVVLPGTVVHLTIDSGTLKTCRIH